MPIWHKSRVLLRPDSPPPRYHQPTRKTCKSLMGGTKCPCYKVWALTKAATWTKKENSPLGMSAGGNTPLCSCMSLSCTGNREGHHEPRPLVAVWCSGSKGSLSPPESLQALPNPPTLPVTTTPATQRAVNDSAALDGLQVYSLRDNDNGQ